MLNEVGVLAQNGEFAAAQRALAKFKGRLGVHIDAEEEILFPVYDQFSVGEGLTNVMLGEHAVIRRLLSSLSDNLQTEDVSMSLQTALALARVLEAHNAKEERFLYPDSDAAFEVEAERDALIDRIEERLDRPMSAP